MVWKEFENIIPLDDEDKWNTVIVIDTVTVEKNIEVEKIVEIEKIIEVPVEVHDTIYIVENKPTTIKAADGTEMKMTVRSGVVYIENAPMGSAVNVYKENGVEVKSLTVADIVTEIALPDKGVYIISVGGKTFKVKI